MVAESRLSPAAKAKVRGIFFGAPLVTAAIFADDYRPSYQDAEAFDRADALKRFGAF
ncbi:hypothetical protein NKI01_28975 [Mesorhizobium sp. M0815]|uniref:hypothetical protein n=1 Tax=Mesorhizobium sp. M0815 TaxID=2957005 RepID=UPI003338F505